MAAPIRPNPTPDNARLMERLGSQEAVSAYFTRLARAKADRRREREGELAILRAALVALAEGSS